MPRENPFPPPNELPFLERYFDYAATTPTDPAVVNRMNLVQSDFWANPSSSHSPGRKARVLLEQSRHDLTELLGGNAGWRTLFTSGGTESDNAAVIGVAAARSPASDHIIISSIEHSAVRNSALSLLRLGIRVKEAPVDRLGVVDIDWLRSHISPKTALVSIVTVNNEIGTLQPVAEVAALCRALGVPLHTDAVQALGNFPLGPGSLGADLVSFSAHKVYGPKGLGALILREGTPFVPLIYGGDQEFGFRSGTENLPAIAGFVEAARLIFSDSAARIPRLRNLRSQLIQTLQAAYPEAVLNGPRDGGHPGIAHFFLPDAPSDTWIAALDSQGFYASTGSACHSGASEPSAVVKAIRAPDSLRRSAIRFSLGRHSTDAGVTALVAAVLSIRDRIRASKRV
jgi:cysteine desulfurase